MDFQITRPFIPLSTLVTTGDTSTLGTQRIGFYNPNTFSALASASGVTELLVAMGSGVDKWGSFKTSRIKQANVKSFTGVVADTTSKQQITYIGFDEVNDDKSPSFGCDEEYIFTFKIREYYSRGVYQPLIQESVRVKTACCDDCSTNCDSLDCKPYMQEAVDKINANPLLSKYITASLVSKCTGSADTTVFALTLPDPGTNVGGVATLSYTTAAAGLTPGANNAVTGTASASGINAAFDITVGAGGTIETITVDTAGTLYVIGETITIAGTSLGGGATPADDVVITVLSTSGAEGVLLDEIKTMYSSFVDDTDTDIVITADTDGDQDSNSTGNIRIELTPSAGVELADLADYNGVAWESVTLTAGTEACVCGIKVVGNALDEFGNTCIPEAVPYVANLVRFQANVHEGPYNTQDFDIESDCEGWFVTTTQEIKYALGEGLGMAERERHYFRNNLPGNTYERGYYWNPIYNNDTVLYADSSVEYIVYRLVYTIADPSGFENRTPIEEALEIWVDSTNTTLANSIEGFLSTFTGITVNVA